eukprot:1156818-Pelagomonas_calceolata.AAC.4
MVHTCNKGAPSSRLTCAGKGALCNDGPGIPSLGLTCAGKGALHNEGRPKIWSAHGTAAAEASFITAETAVPAFLGVALWGLPGDLRFSTLAALVASADLGCPGDLRGATVKQTTMHNSSTDVWILLEMLNVAPILTRLENTMDSSSNSSSPSCARIRVTLTDRSCGTCPYKAKGLLRLRRGQEHAPPSAAGFTGYWPVVASKPDIPSNEQGGPCKDAHGVLTLEG